MNQMMIENIHAMIVQTLQTTKILYRGHFDHFCLLHFPPIFPLLMAINLQCMFLIY